MGSSVDIGSALQQRDTRERQQGGGWVRFVADAA